MKKISILKIALGITVGLLIMGSGFGWFYIVELQTMSREGRRLARIVEADFARREGKLRDEIAVLQRENKTFNEALETEQNRNKQFAGQISDIQGVVGGLVKLSQTDEELLQKYSKVYFLNENYAPLNLSQIPTRYIHQEEKAEYVHTNVMPFLQDLLSAASGSGNELKIISAFRSFGEQTQLKSAYTIRYGSGANAFSADQGYSEHQLGSAFDFTAPELGASFTQLGTTEAYRWLLENAHRFGFVISYPEGNAYYIFEPWHWRFVGRALATKFHDEGRYFYDADQREINEYLISVFD